MKCNLVKLILWCHAVFSFFVGFYGVASIAIAYKNAEEYIIPLYFPPKLSSLRFSS